MLRWWGLRLKFRILPSFLLIFLTLLIFLLWERYLGTKKENPRKEEEEEEEEEEEKEEEKEEEEEGERERKEGTPIVKALSLFVFVILFWYIPTSLYR